MGVLSVEDLTKDYGDVRANDAVTLEIESGEIFGYLGPNGAGKTTTIRTLMGFQSPTSGTATVLGADVHDEDALVEAKQRIGYLPATPAFDEDATGREILDLHASLKGESRRDELLELFDAPVEREIRGYSTGQRQKLGLVQAFMHDPELLVMDEPTAGLDPLVQRTFNEFVRDEKAAGKTFFLSSHVLSEVRRVCDRIGIIRDGRIVEVESVGGLLQRAGKFVRVRIAAALDREDLVLEDVHELTVQQIADSRADRPMATADDDDGGRDRDAHAPSDGDDMVTELTFTYTGSFDALVDFLARHHVLELDVEEAPLEQVFMRFYDANTADEVPDPGANAETEGEAVGDVDTDGSVPSGEDTNTGGEW
jgi:ABC-2 type transport system ATP-binding protein